MGVENIVDLLPGDTQPPLEFTVLFLENGAFRVSGSDDAVKMLDGTHFQLNSPHVALTGDGSYFASSG
jgi:hypothetical protein